MCCTYANQISPPGAETTIQSILDSVHYGLGSGMGALIGGMIYDNVGSVKLFIISAALSVVSMIIAIIQCTYSLNRGKLYHWIFNLKKIVLFFIFIFFKLELDLIPCLNLLVTYITIILSTTKKINPQSSSILLLPLN